MLNGFDNIDIKISEYYHGRSPTGFCTIYVDILGINCEYLPLKLKIVSTFVIRFGDLTFLKSVTK